MSAPRHSGPQPYPHAGDGEWKPTPSTPPGKGRRWPWIVGGIVGLFVVIGACGANDAELAAERAATPPAPTVAAPVEPTEAAAPTVAPVTRVILPEVEGRNGGIVFDELTELGLTNFDLASRDEDDTVVLLPQNWTAVSIEPGAGTEVDSDDTVVVTMTKE